MEHTEAKLGAFTSNKLFDYGTMMLKIASMKEIDDSWNCAYQKFKQSILFIETDDVILTDFCKFFHIGDLNSTDEIPANIYISFLIEYFYQKRITRYEFDIIYSFVKDKDISILQYIYWRFGDEYGNDDIKKKLLAFGEDRMYSFDVLDQELVDILKKNPEKQKNLHFKNQDYDLVNELFFSNKNVEFIYRLKITQEIFYFILNSENILPLTFFSFKKKGNDFCLRSISNVESFTFSRWKIIDYLNQKDIRLSTLSFLSVRLINEEIISIKWLNNVEVLTLVNNVYISSASFLMKFEMYKRIPENIRIDKRIIDEKILENYSKKKLSLFIDNMDDYAKSILVDDELISIAKDEKRRLILIISHDSEEYTNAFLSLYSEDKIGMNEMRPFKISINENIMEHILNNFSGVKLENFLVNENYILFPSLEFKERFYNLVCIKLKNENEDFVWNKERIIINQEFEEKLSINGFLIELIPRYKRTLKLLKIAYQQNKKTISSAPFHLRLFV